MDWLMHTVEKDLGVDRRQQGPGPRPREVVALVPTRWVLGLRERRIMRCARFDSISEAEIRTYLQCSQAKLPPGWTRVCIQGLRKSKLSYRLARDPCHQQMEFMSQDSYVKTMQCVSQHNVRYYTNFDILCLYIVSCGYTCHLMSVVKLNQMKKISFLKTMSFPCHLTVICEH